MQARGYRCFPVKFCQIFKSTCFAEYLQTAATVNLWYNFYGAQSLLHQLIVNFTKFSKLENCLNRNSHQRCSMKKGVLRNFVKFTGKHLCQSLFFNKVAGLRFPSKVSLSSFYSFSSNSWGTQIEKTYSNIGTKGRITMWIKINKKII